MKPQMNTETAEPEPSYLLSVFFASFAILRVFVSLCLCGEQDVCALRGPAFLRVLCVSVANRRMPIFTDSQKLNFSAN